MPASARLFAAIGAPVLEAGSSDSVKCGCGSTLSFRSNPFKYGRTESRCLNCDPSWEPVLPTITVPRFIDPDRPRDAADEEALAIAKRPRDRARMSPAQRRSVDHAREAKARAWQAESAMVLEMLPTTAEGALTIRVIAMRCQRPVNVIERIVRRLRETGRLEMRLTTRGEVGRRGIQGGRYPAVYWRAKE